MYMYIGVIAMGDLSDLSAIESVHPFRSGLIAGHLITQLERQGEDGEDR